MGIIMFIIFGIVIATGKLMAGEDASMGCLIPILVLLLLAVIVSSVVLPALY